MIKDVLAGGRSVVERQDLRGISDIVKLRLCDRDGESAE